MTNEELQKIFDQMRALSQKYPVEFDLAHSQIIGYKILRTCDVCEHSSGKFILVSPQISETHWENGQLEAHLEPHPDTMNGIHFAKSPRHPALRQYLVLGHTPFSQYLVRCVLSGTVIETEHGYRAQHAEIISLVEIDSVESAYQFQLRMMTNEHWKSYQEVEYTETQRIRRRPWKNRYEYRANPFADPGYYTNLGS